MRIAILARSNKSMSNNEYGCCVAGITECGDWIRLVSDKTGCSLPQDDNTPQISTVIEADVTAVPIEYQSENAVLGKWSPVFSEDVNSYVKKLVQSDERYLFGNTVNKLTRSEMRGVIGTLRLVEVSELRTYRPQSGKCLTSFIYKGINYDNIHMTAPNFYASRGTERKFGDANIVVSLPDKEPFLKFVAAIHPPS